MKKIFLIISMFLFSVSCGVKGDPEYKSQNSYNKIKRLV
jgi:hypothetical protein